MKDFLRESFPNPERKGCPDEDTLQALAEDRLPPSHPALLHVGSCSECYAEYLHFRQDFEEAGSGKASPAHSKAPAVVPAPVPVASVARTEHTIPFPSRFKAGPLAAAAAALIILLGGGALYLKHSGQASAPPGALVASATPDSKHPAQAPAPSGVLVASSTPVDIQVDLFSAITTRGVGDGATPIQQVSLPAAVVNLHVTLPRYSETGEYQILVSKDRAGHEPVAKGLGEAVETKGKVLVSVKLDLRSAKPGSYFLATVRGSDNGTYYYPLEVK